MASIPTVHQMSMDSPQSGRGLCFIGRKDNKAAEEIEHSLKYLRAGFGDK